MARPARVTAPLLDVMEVLFRAFDDDVEVHGWALIKATRRSGPTVYGILDRIEDAGWVSARWEELEPGQNRPRRRFYRLTRAGAVAAYDLLSIRRPSVIWPAGRSSGGEGPTAAVDPCGGG
jgi:PadR family transcriptional regulator, regulatory protein PadR